jgi:cytochrome P450
VRIGEAAIAEGQKVLMFLGAANPDPRKWEKADVYDITRWTSGHVGCGSGVHICIGQLLARLEGEAILGALAGRVEFIEISYRRTDVIQRNDLMALFGLACEHVGKLDVLFNSAGTAPASRFELCGWMTGNAMIDVNLI